MIKERIIELIEYKGIKKESFYTQIGMTSASFRGKAKETPLNSNAIENILSIIPDVNLEWLLTGNGEMFKKVNPDSISSNIKETVTLDDLQRVPTVVTVDSMNQDNIVLVPIQAQAGYLVGYTNPDFIQTLPSYRLPNLNNGIFRMFQVKGRSMFPTLHEHSYVVGQFVENWMDDIKDGRIYVIVSKEDGVVVKRVLNRIVKYSNLYCKSDNRKEYPNFPIDVQDIQEVWDVKMALLIDLPNPADLYYRMDDVESEIEYLKDKITQLTK